MAGSVAGGHRRSVAGRVGLALLLAACALLAVAQIDPDTALAWDRAIAASGVAYVPVVGTPVVIAPGDAVPPEAELQPSNNNCGMTLFEGRAFFGWRTSRSHFASGRARILVASAPAEEVLAWAAGGNATQWEIELEIAQGADVREPNFYVRSGELVFTFFEAGTNPFGFDPRVLWRTVRGANGVWGPLEAWGQESEIVWDYGAQGGVTYVTSYIGNHYDREARPNMTVFFNASTDGGYTFQPLGKLPGGGAYNGGATEVAFTLDIDGNMWGISRNDEGDATGWGAHLFFGPAADLGAWQMFPSSQACFPDIYMSPKVFRHGNDIYLVGRTDPGGPYDRGNADLTFEQQRTINIVSYSFRAHGTGLWHINQADHTIDPVMTLPGCGDTAFPSIVRVGEHRYLIINYSNPFELCPTWTWLRGQASLNGTFVYMIDVNFVPVSDA